MGRTVKLEEGSSEKNLKLQPVETSAFASFPVPTGFETEINYQTDRITKKIQLTQFPINIATARTVHKLQGRSLQNLLVSSWSYTSNWIYVVLSRVTTSNGLFVRTPLLYTHTNTAESEKDIKSNNEFHNFCRNTNYHNTVINNIKVNNFSKTTFMFTFLILTLISKHCIRAQE